MKKKLSLLFSLILIIAMSAFMTVAIAEKPTATVAVTEPVYEAVSVVKSEPGAVHYANGTTCVINFNKPFAVADYTKSLQAEDNKNATNVLTHILFNGVPFGELNQWTPEDQIGTGCFVGNHDANWIAGNYENGIEFLISERKYLTSMIVTVKAGFTAYGNTTTADAAFSRNVDGTFSKIDTPTVPEAISVVRMPYDATCWIFYIGFNMPYDGIGTGAAGTTYKDMRDGVTFNGVNAFSGGRGGGYFNVSEREKYLGGYQYMGYLFETDFKENASNKLVIPAGIHMGGGTVTATEKIFYFWDNAFHPTEMKYTREALSVVKSGSGEADFASGTTCVINFNEPFAAADYAKNLQAEENKNATNVLTHILFNGVPFGELNQWTQEDQHYGTGCYVGNHAEGWIAGNYENGIEFILSDRKYLTGMFVTVKAGFMAYGNTTTADATFSRNADGTFSKIDTPTVPEAISVVRMPYDATCWKFYIGFNMPYDGLETGAVGTTYKDMRDGVTFNDVNAFSGGRGGGFFNHDKYEKHLGGYQYMGYLYKTDFKNDGTDTLFIPSGIHMGGGTVTTTAKTYYFWDNAFHTTQQPVLLENVSSFTENNSSKVTKLVFNKTIDFGETELDFSSELKIDGVTIASINLANSNSVTLAWSVENNKSVLTVSITNEFLSDKKSIKLSLIKDSVTANGQLVNANFEKFYQFENNFWANDLTKIELDRLNKLFTQGIEPMVKQAGGAVMFTINFKSNLTADLNYLRLANVLATAGELKARSLAQEEGYYYTDEILEKMIRLDVRNTILDSVILNGKSLREWLALETNLVNVADSIQVDLRGKQMLIFVSGSSAAKITDITQTQTITLKSGLVVENGFHISQDISYKAVSNVWAEYDPNVVDPPVVDPPVVDPPVVDPPVVDPGEGDKPLPKKGCNSVVGAVGTSGIMLCVLILTLAGVVITKKRKED